MKLPLLFLLFAFGMMGMLAAQQTIFEDDFESYSPNDKVARAASGFWDTWSGATGGAEDGTVSTDYAASGDHSMRINGTIDMLLRIANEPLTDGRYKLAFKMLVPANNYAYINALHFFDGANSSWATQAYYRPNGTGTLDGDGESIATFDQPAGEWFDVIIVVDLDDNFVTFYNNEEEIHSWKWSAGTFGGSGQFTLEALNFYAWAAEGTPLFFVDDVSILKVNKPGDDIVLTGNLNPDKTIDLDWTSAGSPERFIVTDRSNVLTTSNENDFVVTKPYPAVHDYQVGAHYTQEGYRFSNNVEIDVEGGKDRNFVVFEVGTGTWCPNCPAAARGVDQMHDEGLDVGIIEYHNDDPYVNAEGTQRLRYYNVTGYPTSFKDGDVAVVGGSYAGNLYPTFKSNYDERLERRALYDVDATLMVDDNFIYELNVDINELYEYFEGDLTLHIALTESNIADVWQGMTEIDFALRKMYPNADGTAIDPANGATNFSTTFSLDPSYVRENCELVIFLQHEDTKEILNGHVFKITDAATISATTQIKNVDIQLSPNPVHTAMTIENAPIGKATVFAANGAVLEILNINSSTHVEQVSDWQTGTYLLQFTTEDGQVITKKVVKN